MSDLERIVVLAGGLSPEREVSLRSGDRVRDALAEAGIHAIVADADSALLSLLRADPPSAVFPAIHGVCGEDGAISEVLGLLGVPYVGSVASACQMAFDKPTAKALTAAAGLATPPSVTLPRETFHDLGAAAVIDLIVARLGLPLYVKPSRGGSALGAGAVRTAAELPGRGAELLRLRRHRADRAARDRHRGGGRRDRPRPGPAGAPGGGDRARRGRVRLRRQVHRGQDRVLRPGPAARARSRRRPRGSRSPRTRYSACATCPGPT